MNDLFDTTGVFVSESKNRFIALVRVDNEIVEAYVQCSCRLDNFINLKGKKIYLKKISNPKRAKYIVVACKVNRKLMILSPKIANDLFAKYLFTRNSSFLGKNRKTFIREYSFSNYKSDFYLEKENIIIEVKSILSVDKYSVFPTVYSERALHQLECIESLLSIHKVYFCIISLYDNCFNVKIDKQTSLGGKLFELYKKGLIINAFKIMNKKGVRLKKIDVFF